MVRCSVAENSEIYGWRWPFDGDIFSKLFPAVFISYIPASPDPWLLSVPPTSDVQYACRIEYLL